MRETKTLLRVLHYLYFCFPLLTYGYNICKTYEMKSGVVYPIISRLTDLGWLEVGMEEIDEVKAGRPRRRYIRLSPEGYREAARLLDKHDMLGGY